MAGVLLHAGSLEQFRQRHYGSLLTLPGNGHQQEAGFTLFYRVCQASAMSTACSDVC